MTRPRGGINEWLHWLPVSLHKKLYYVMKLICGYSRRYLAVRRGAKGLPAAVENGETGVGLSAVLEADVKKIVAMARQTYETYGSLFFFFFHISSIFWLLLHCFFFIFIFIVGTARILIVWKWFVVY